MEEITLSIEGMTCAHCEMTVTKALKEISGVKSVSVSLDENAAFIEYKPSKTSPEKLIKAVEKVGYKATKQ
ncbi:MAG: heavy-metal-associated domain-containing protein [Candidatus Thorarchaeota archaeon]